MNDITRRTFLKQTAAGAAALGPTLIPNRSAFAEKRETLRIGYLPITDAAPLLIAHARGYFQEEGLSVEKPVRVRAWSTLVESFLTRKFNLTHLLLPIPLWMRYNNGAPVKVLAWDHTNGSAVTVHHDLGIETFADLGGRQVAVPYWYSMHNVILQLGLRKRGLRAVIQPQTAPLAPDEVNLFVLPPPEMPVALSGRKISAYIVAEPFNAIGEMRTGAKILRFTGDIWKNHPCCVVVMHEESLKSRPVFTQKAVNAVVRAQLWAIRHPEEAARVLSREGGNYLPAPEDVLLRVFTGYETSRYGEGVTPQAIRHPEWGVRRIGFQPYPYPSATRFILEEMRHTVMEGDARFLKTLDPDRVVKDLVETSFVKKAIDNVGGVDKFDLIDPDRPWDREEVIEL